MRIGISVLRLDEEKNNSDNKLNPRRYLLDAVIYRYPTNLAVNTGDTITRRRF